MDTLGIVAALAVIAVGGFFGWIVADVITRSWNEVEIYEVGGDEDESSS